MKVKGLDPLAYKYNGLDVLKIYSMKALLYEKEADNTPPEGIYASTYGLVPNDASEGQNNVDKFIACLNANPGQKFIFDGTYHMGNTESAPALTATYIDIEGWDGGKLIFDAQGWTRRLFKPNSLISSKLKKLEFENLSADEQMCIFWQSEKLGTRLDLVDIDECTYKGKISPYRITGQDLDPDVVNFGITTFKFNNCNCSGITAGGVYLKSIPYDVVELKGADINNFVATFFDGSIDNNYTNHNKIKLARKNAYIDNNVVSNDDDWWDTATDAYHAFIVLEGDDVKYHSNNVSGLKTLNDVAVYDSYLSCETVHSHHNNISDLFSLSKKSVFTLIKAKTGINNPTRLYEYNTYTITADFAARIGRSVDELGVGFINADSDNIESFEIRNCIFNIYEMYFRTHSDTIKEYILKHNTMNIQKASGNMLFQQMIAGKSSSAAIEDNNIAIAELGTHWDTATGGSYAHKLNLLATSDSKNTNLDLANVSLKRNIINAPLAHLLYLPDAGASVIDHEGNNITVQSAHWEQDVYPTTENIPVTIV